LEAATEDEAIAKKNLNDAKADLAKYEKLVGDALRGIKEEGSSEYFSEFDAGVMATKIGPAIDKYYKADRAWVAAAQTVYQNKTDEAEAALRAAITARENASEEIIQIVSAAADAREKHIQALLAKRETQKVEQLQRLDKNGPKRELPSIYRKKGELLQDLEPTKERSRSELLADRADSLSVLADQFDESPAAVSRALADDQNAIRRKTALQTQLDECETSKPEMDRCLLGTWECISFKENIRSYTGGGTGFRVTFAADGTETVDYGPMQPIKAGNDIVSYVGTASAKVSTKDGVARVDRMINAGARLNAVAAEVGLNWKPKIPGLGAGGLGGTKDGSKYTCTQEILEYETSSAADQRPNCSVKLKRIAGPQ